MPLPRLSQEGFWLEGPGAGGGLHCLVSPCLVHQADRCGGQWLCPVIYPVLNARAEGQWWWGERKREQGLSLHPLTEPVRVCWGLSCLLPPEVMMQTPFQGSLFLGVVASQISTSCTQNTQKLHCSIWQGLGEGCRE